MDHRR